MMCPQPIFSLRADFRRRKLRMASCLFRLRAEGVVAILMLLAFALPVQGCTRDDHCVPASCCHARTCVDLTKVDAPNCTTVLCTGGCHLNSLDCGGECRCSKSRVCAPFFRAGMPPDAAPEHQWVDTNNNNNNQQSSQQTQKTVKYVKRVRKS
jgi:hypothetical protein